MTLPRPVLPGEVVFVTRRVLHQHFLFRPDPAIRNAFLYLLAHYALAYGIQVCALLLMSDHYHLVFIDRDGCRPDFLRDFHRAFALFTQRLRCWQGSVWDGRQTTVDTLRSLDDELRALAYLAVNPVAAGLVRHERHWPGARSDVRQMGHQVLVATRPTLWLDADHGDWPPEVRLELVNPPHLEALGEAGRVAMLQQLDKKRDEARNKVRESRRGFLGAKACGRVSPFDQPISRTVPGQPAAHTDAPQRRTGPWTSESCRARATQRRAWLEAYRAARTQWRRDNRLVAFPAGTWMMVRAHAVRVEQPPPI